MILVIQHIELKFILKMSLIFMFLSFSFSIIGSLFPESSHTYIVGNPFEHNSVTLEHISGHIFWGGLVGLCTFSIRYVVLGGSFAILLDADHLLQFLDIELVARMSHSIPFAIIVSVILYLILSKKDFILPTIAFSAILSHIAFDIFIADMANMSTSFPIFSPIILDSFNFDGIVWLYIEIIAVVIVLIAKVIDKKKIFCKTK